MIEQLGIKFAQFAYNKISDALSPPPQVQIVTATHHNPPVRMPVDGSYLSQRDFSGFTMSGPGGACR